MKTTAKGKNRKRGYYELPTQLIRELDDLSPGLGATLSDRFKRIGEHLEATAGLRGQVSLASQLHMDSNLVKGVQDPVDEMDGVNLRTLLRYSTCARLTEILEECNDHALLIEDEVEVSVTPGASLEIPFFFGVTITPPLNLTSGAIGGANVITAMLFTLPNSLTVSQITFEVTTAAAGKFCNIGLYDGDKNKVLEMGPQSVASIGVKQVSITPVELDPGIYYLVYTSDGGGVRSLSINTATNNVFNASEVRRGTNSVNSTGAGVLPASLATLTATTNNLPLALFEE